MSGRNYFGMSRLEIHVEIVVVEIVFHTWISLLIVYVISPWNETFNDLWILINRPSFFDANYIHWTNTDDAKSAETDEQNENLTFSLSL